MQDLAYLPSFITLRDHYPEVPVVWYLWVVLHILSCLYLFMTRLQVQIQLFWHLWKWSMCAFTIIQYTRYFYFIIFLFYYHLSSMRAVSVVLLFVLFSLLLEEFLVQRNNIVKYLLLSKLLTLLEYSTVLNLSWLPKDPLWLHSNLWAGILFEWVVSKPFSC